jgi:3D (Asp-Asp-Asp) domain-containing protein
MTPNDNQSLLPFYLSELKELARDVLELLPSMCFIILSSTPAQALAFDEYIDLSHQPLIFERDPTLADRAIEGINGSIRHRTVGSLLQSPASQIPDAAPHLVPGMAIRVLATAYSSSGAETDSNPFATASGAPVGPGTLAANFLPFGSQVRIGSFVYTVKDRMNMRYNGKYIVDKWVGTREEALRFGVHVVEMEIVSVP